MFLTEFNQAFSPRGTHRLSAGVLVAGNRVQESGAGPGEGVLQLLNIKACFVHRYTDDVQPMIGENLKGQEVAGFFHKDRVARLGQM